MFKGSILLQHKVIEGVVEQGNRDPMFPRVNDVEGAIHRAAVYDDYAAKIGQQGFTGSQEPADDLLFILADYADIYAVHHHL